MATYVNVVDGGEYFYNNQGDLDEYITCKESKLPRLGTVRVIDRRMHFLCSIRIEDTGHKHIGGAQVHNYKLLWMPYVHS